MNRRAVSVARLDESLLRSLLSTPPPEFVAARNAAAKQLKADGRRDDADVLAAIRRPAWSEWALNRAAADHPDATSAFADAADAMRAAQAAAIDGRRSDVAGALRAVREASTALAKLADRGLRAAGRPSELATIVERLTTVAAAEPSSAALRSGVLRDDADADAGAGDQVAASPEPRPEATQTPPARRSRARRTTPDPPAAQPPTEPPPDPAVERRAAKLALAKAERAAVAAEREESRARRHADEAAHAHATAARAAEKAAAALAGATERRDATAARLAAADEALATARAAVAARQQQVAALEPGATTRRPARRVR